MVSQSSVAATDDRLTREQTSRAAAEIEAWPEWTPAQNTTAPPARDAFEQKWVRCRVVNADDEPNIIRNMQQGWRPRQVDTVPPAFKPFVRRFGDFGEVIRNQDCILMERPKAMGDKVRAHVAGRNQRLRQSVQEYMGQRMPRQHGSNGGTVEEFEARATVGAGRPARFGGD
jgi:hypothetical protein